jgi:hypothetical protein
MFCSDQVQRRRGQVGANGFMGFVDKARHRFRQPVIRPRKKEGMVVKLVPILHSSAVDFGGHAARMHERAGIEGQLVAPLTDFERSFTRRCTLTPLGVNAEFVFDTPETLFERTGHRRGNSAGMPVETENTAECLEPERIGQSTQQLLGTVIGNDVCGDFAREARHPRKEPRWRSAGVQGKVGEARATGHVKSYGFLRRRYAVTVRASGSNPKFRMN